MWVRPNAGVYTERNLRVTGGDVATRYYAASAAGRGVIWVGGVGGGWDSPADDLYPKSSEALTQAGISSLRIRFRNPHSLRDGVADVQAGIDFLQNQNVAKIAVVGHSFGGAVVIQAAAQNRNVCTVVTLSTQSYGADPVAQLGPHCSILLVHGVADRVLPWPGERTAAPGSHPRCWACTERSGWRDPRLSARLDYRGARAGAMSTFVRTRWRLNGSERETYPLPNRPAGAVGCNFDSRFFNKRD